MSSPLDGVREALAVERRRTPGCGDGSRLWDARNELGVVVGFVREHYGLSDAEAVLLLAQVLQEYAGRVGAAGIVAAGNVTGYETLG